MRAKRNVQILTRFITWLHSRGADDESGQSALLTAIALLGLIAFAAVVFDGGNTYAQRRRAQNAADAGVLAGIRIVADKGTNSQVLQNVTSYAVAKNGATQVDANYVFLDNTESPISSFDPASNPPAGARAIHAITHITFNTFFATIIGWQSSQVAADAVAAFGSAIPSNFQPLARHCDTPPQDGSDWTLQSICHFELNTLYDIWNGGGPGNLGWLSWTGPTDANTIAAELNPDATITSYVPPSNHPDCDDGQPATQMKPGCWIQGSTGVVNSSDVTLQLDSWKASGLVDIPMTIALYDLSDLNGSNTNYHIIGYAEFVLHDYRLSGSKMVYGEFIDYTIPGEICWTCKSDTGARTIALTGLPLPIQ